MEWRTAPKMPVYLHFNYANMAKIDQLQVSTSMKSEDKVEVEENPLSASRHPAPMLLT